MCGIFGEFSFNRLIEIDKALERLNAMVHRGPDGFGYEVGNVTDGCYELFHNREDHRDKRDLQATYFLGHRRLSINDLAANAFQPMESSDKRFSITFNGEIYNFMELKKELLKKGCHFNTDHSDTEVLLNAFLVWGEACLDKLKGMFAFAILDRQERKVFIARDRIGQKPLYYEFNDERFIFSSELTSLIKYDEYPRRIDEIALNQYLIFGYIPHPHSIFEGIKKLPPANFALIDLEKQEITLKKYWDIDFNENDVKDEEQFINGVESCLADSVSLRLRADVPIGAFISGGIDSTLVIGNMSRIGGKKFDVFGADFPGSEHSEKKYIEEASANYDQRLNLLDIDFSKAQNIGRIIDVFDEPFDGGSSVALFDLFKEAGKKYKVILTGDGGDELFAGYLKYMRFSIKENLVKKIKKIPMVTAALRLLRASGFISHKLKRLLEFIENDRITNYLHLNYNFDLPLLLRDGKKRQFEGFAIIDENRKIVGKEKMSQIKALQYLEMKTILPGRMLYKLDRFSMHYSVEARSPFLDHKLVEYAFSIPENFNFYKSELKILLKKILEKDFPKEFVYRKKQGFGNPFSLWFNSSDRQDFFSLLLDKESLVFKFLDYQKLHVFYPQIKNGKTIKKNHEVWRLIVLAHFMENYKPYIKH